MTNMQKSPPRQISATRLTLGALYIALFPLASKVIPPIMLIPGVPITLQNFIVAMMGLTLGLRTGLMSCLAVLVLTLVGVPMMSSSAGPAALFGPTGGYIIGFIFIALVTGLYANYIMPKLINKKIKGMSIHIPASFFAGIVGILLQYLCGSVMLVITTKQPISALWGLFIANMAFLPGDLIKIGLASICSLIMFSKPVFNRLLQNDA